MSPDAKAVEKARREVEKARKAVAKAPPYSERWTRATMVLGALLADLRKMEGGAGQLPDQVNDPARRLFRVCLTYVVDVEVEAETEAEAVERAHLNGFQDGDWRTEHEEVQDLGKVCEDGQPYGDRPRRFKVEVKVSVGVEVTSRDPREAERIAAEAVHQALGGEGAGEAEEMDWTVVDSRAEAVEEPAEPYKMPSGLALANEVLPGVIDLLDDVADDNPAFPQTHQADCRKAAKDLRKVLGALKLLDLDLRLLNREGGVEEPAEPYGASESEKAVEALRRVAEGLGASGDRAVLLRTAAFIEALDREAQKVRDTVGWDSGNWDDEESGRRWGVGSVFRCWGDWLTDDCKTETDKTGLYPREVIVTGATDAWEQVIEGLGNAEGLLNLVDGYTGVDPLPESQA